MTSPYERRLRKLEAQPRPAGGNVMVLGIPAWPQPSPAEIGRADIVLRVAFVSAKHGQQIKGATDAWH